MRRDFGRHYLLECDAPSARANQNKQVSLLPRSRSEGSRAFPFQATRNRQGAARWLAAFIRMRSSASSATTNVAPQLSNYRLFISFTAPTQQMLISLELRPSRQHDRYTLTMHRSFAIIARIHYALHFAASTIPPYRCEKAYLPGPKSNAPNREPASVSVHSLVFAVRPVFRESERSPVTRSATN